MPPDSPPTLSIVAPCFNEQESLREFHQRAASAAAAAIGSYEIILVDDGSRDDTWSIMQDIARHDPHVIPVKLSRNHGHQLALTAGLTVAQGSLVLIIDADLQDPPELLPAMLEQIHAGADVVYGQRRKRAGESPFKRATASLFYRLLTRIVEISIPLDTGDFRLMTRRAVNVINQMPEQHRFIRGMVAWIGMRQVPLLYDRCPRYAGTTKYPLRRMIRFAIDGITGFSIAPLRAASYLGALMACVSVMLLLYTLTQWVLGHTIEGWTSIATMFLTVSAVQLLVLGVIGEYLGRLYMQSKNRPLFIIEQIGPSMLPDTRTPPSLDQGGAGGGFEKPTENNGQPKV